MGWDVIMLGALGALLLVAIVTDVRARIIPDRLNIAIAAAAPLWWWAAGLSPWPGVAVQLGLAAGIFALGLLAFNLGQMGGGDVKLLTALALWLPPHPLVRMLTVMAILGGVLTLVMLAWHRARRRQGHPEIPYGVAIATATIWVMTNDILTSSAQ